jgi:hypothetical protein
MNDVDKLLNIVKVIGTCQLVCFVYLIVRLEFMCRKYLPKDYEMKSKRKVKVTKVNEIVWNWKLRLLATLFIFICLFSLGILLSEY